MAGEKAKRLHIEISVGPRRFAVDAALWLPEGAAGKVPLVCGLDFTGPAGVLSSESYPLDPDAQIYSRPEYGAKDGRLAPVLRGTAAHRWPIPLLTNAGMAVLVSCYGSWVPDSAEDWQSHGVYPLLNGQENCPGSGAISLWAWSIQRLLDVAGTLDEVDQSNISVAGHSRLGKAALWATANDPRIAAVFANNSGCAGAAPFAHPIGETLGQMVQGYPHWLLQGNTPHVPDFDQHHLLALIAPRKTYIACAEDDLWADPAGTYLALTATGGDDWPPLSEALNTAAQIIRGPMGYHLRPGGHDLLPYDWQKFLTFLGR
jgi:hypothetical protein